MSKNLSALKAGRPSARQDKEKTLSGLTDSPPTKRVNFDLTVEDHARLKIYAARQGKSIKDILNEFVAQLPE